jgi:predicted metallopeptidase
VPSDGRRNVMASYHRVSYRRDHELERVVAGIARALGFDHVDPSRLAVMRSTGTRSRRVLARCHALSRVFQKALGVEAHYVIEILSENFDRLTREEKTKTLIHELMHIPRSFAGGFRHHNPYVNRRTVERAYWEYLKISGG